MSGQTYAGLADIYPWQEAVWEQFESMRSQDRIPHALLLHGPEGIGKFRLALALAERLLCGGEQSGRACGQCHACNLNRAGTHPDLVLMRSEGKSGRILIDQVRELIDQASATAHQGLRRVALFLPAEAMNANAANALLKILEEPGRSTMFLLVSHNPWGLPATVRSRCQSLPLAVPAAEQALPWLEEEVGGDAAVLLSAAGGRPLAALLLAAEGGAQKHAQRSSAWLELLAGRHTCR